MGYANGLLTPHAEYLALRSDPSARAMAYGALFADAMPDALVQEIRDDLQQQMALGTDRLRAWVEARTRRFATVRAAGRQPSGLHCP